MQRKRLKRWLIGLFIVLGLPLAAYLTLPWWLPKDWIRHQIEQELTRKLGREAVLEAFTLTREGFDLRGLAIRRLGVDQKENLLTVAYISGPYEPLNMIRGRLSRLHIERPELNLVIDREGRLNVVDLPGRLDMEHNQLDLGTLVISQATVHLYSESTPDKGVAIDIPHIGWSGGAETLRWRLDAKLRGYEGAALTCSGRTLAPDGDDNHWVQVEFKAENLPLQSLPLHDVLNPQLAALNKEQPPRLAPIKGQGTLEGVFSLDTAGIFRFDTHLTLNELDVTLAGGEVSELPAGDSILTLLAADKLLFTTQGRYDLTTTAIDIESALLRGPGVELDFAASYKPITAQQDTHYHLQRGHIVFDRLLAASPRLAQWDIWNQLGLAVSGELQASGKLDLGGRRSHFDFQINADNTAFTSIAGDKAQGKPLSLSVDADFQNDTAALRLNDINLQWATLRMDGSLYAPDVFSLRRQLTSESPRVWMKSLLSRPDLQAMFKLHIDDYDELAQDAPYLAQPLPGVRFHGPLKAELSMQANERRASLLVELPDSAQLTVEHLQDPDGPLVLAKTVGRALNAQLEARADEQGELGGVSLVGKYGDARLEAAPENLAALWAAAAGESRQVRLSWGITRLEDWAGLSPLATESIRQAGLQLTGEAGGKVCVTLEPDNALQLDGDILLGDAGVRVQGSAKAVPPAETRTAPLPRRIYHADVCVNLNELAALHRLMPGLPDAQGELVLPGVTVDHWRGPMQVDATYHRNHVGSRISVNVAGDQAGFQVRRGEDKVIVWGKQPGQPCAIQAQLMLDIPNNFDKLLVAPLTVGSEQPWRVHLEQAQLLVERSQFTLAGKAAFEPPAERRAFDPARYRRLDFNWNADIDARDAWLWRVVQLSQAPLDPNISGAAQMSGHFTLDHRQGLEFAMNADLTGAAWGLIPDHNSRAALARMDKPLNAPCRLAVQLSALPRGQTIKLEALQLELEDNRFSCNGDVQLDGDTLAGDRFDLKRIVSMQLNTDIEAPHLENISHWFPGLRDNKLAGELILRLPLELRLQPEVQPILQPTFIRGDLRGVYRDTPFTLQLHAPELSRERIRLPLCRLTFAENDLSLVADVRMPPMEDSANSSPAVQGDVQVLAEKLDMDDIFKRLGIDSTVSAPSSLDGSHRYVIARVLEVLRHSQVQLSTNISQFKMTDPATQAYMDLAEIRASVAVAEHSLTGRFAASLNGGVTSGVLQSDLALDNPEFTLHTENRNLRVEENILPMIEAQFPGMEVGGTVTEITDQQASLECLLDAACYPVGKGTTLLTDGVLYGPGGPEWMLKVFPGLKLVEYPYERMTNRFTLQANGVQENDIRFRGNTYDIFMEGTSLPVTDPNEYAQALTSLEADFRKLLEQLEAMDRQGRSLSADKVRRLRYDLEGLQASFRRHRAGRMLNVQKAQYIVGVLVRFGPDEPGKPARELIRTPLFTTRGFIIGRNMVGISTTNAPLAEIPKQTPIWRHFQPSP